MEKQKVFWVVLSVSVFVVVVLLVGVLLLRQQPASVARGTVSPSNGTGSQPYEYQREAPLATSPNGPPAATPSPGDQQTMHFYVGEGAPGASSPAVPQSPQGPGTSAPAVGTPSTSPSQVPAATVGPVTAPASSSRTPSIQAPKTRVVKPAAAARVPRKTADYWIQAGSYRSQTKAEELVSLLQNKGLGSRVFSYQSRGDTFYRVRVGPYSNKGEADKFLALVKQVQGLEASFVSMVPPARTSVN